MAAKTEERKKTECVEQVVGVGRRTDEEVVSVVRECERGEIDRGWWNGDLEEGSICDGTGDKWCLESGLSRAVVKQTWPTYAIKLFHRVHADRLRLCASDSSDFARIVERSNHRAAHVVEHTLPLANREINA